MYVCRGHELANALYPLNRFENVILKNMRKVGRKVPHDVPRSLLTEHARAFSCDEECRLSPHNFPYTGDQLSEMH